MTEYRKVDGVITPITHGTEYNSYGEVVRKTVDGVEDAFFHYDDAGRMWRTNDGDGVVKVYLYDRVGNVSSVITNATHNLRDYATAEIAAGIADGVRTDYKRDVLGRVAEEISAKVHVEESTNWLPVGLLGDGPAGSYQAS
jgi:hypothetical protein